MLLNRNARSQTPAVFVPTKSSQDCSVVIAAPHDTTPGPTGWACRLDHEPQLGNDPLDFVEHIAVTVLCCD